MNFEAIKLRCIEDCGCLLWQGAVSESGNPRLASTTVRRVVWIEVKGEIPKGKMVTIDCGNSLCVEPEHLILTTRRKVALKVNLRPDVRVRRAATATRVNRPLLGKISMEIARQIRAGGKTGKAWAAELGVSSSLISKVLNNQSWRESGNPFAGLMR